MIAVLHGDAGTNRYHSWPGCDLNSFGWWTVEFCYLGSQKGKQFLLFIGPWRKSTQLPAVRSLASLS